MYTGRPTYFIRSQLPIGPSVGRPGIDSLAGPGLSSSFFGARVVLQPPPVPPSARTLRKRFAVQRELLRTSPAHRAVVFNASFHLGRRRPSSRGFAQWPVRLEKPTLPRKASASACFAGGETPDYRGCVLLLAELTLSREQRETPPVLLPEKVRRSLRVPGGSINRGPGLHPHPIHCRGRPQAVVRFASVSFRGGPGGGTFQIWMVPS